MAIFTFQAKEGLAQTISGEIDAEDLNRAVAKIVAMGYVPIDVRAEAALPQVFFKSLREIRLPFFRKVPAKDIVFFTGLISELLDAGVSMAETLRIVQKQLPTSYFQQIMTQIYDTVKDGASFSSSLERHPEIFSDLYIHMVKAGEVSSDLNAVLRRLADFLEKDQEVRSQIKSSMLYPGIILAVGILTIIVILVGVIPRITSILEDMDTTLPLVTALLIKFTDYLSRSWAFLTITITAVVLYLRHLTKAPQGKWQCDHLKLKVPILGKMLWEAEMGRFARTFATLLDNGVFIGTALHSASSIMQNEVLRQEMLKIEQLVLSGGSLAGAFQQSSVFPETVISMITVSEETGKTQNGFYKLANYYERRSQQSIKKITTLIEPALILLIGSVVAFIVAAMLLPIFQINQALH